MPYSVFPPPFPGLNGRISTKFYLKKVPDYFKLVANC